MDLCSLLDDHPGPRAGEDVAYMLPLFYYKREFQGPPLTKKCEVDGGHHSIDREPGFDTAQNVSVSCDQELRDEWNNFTICQ